MAVFIEAVFDWNYFSSLPMPSIITVSSPKIFALIRDPKNTPIVAKIICIEFRGAMSPPSNIWTDAKRQ